MDDGQKDAIEASLQAHYGEGSEDGGPSMMFSKMLFPAEKSMPKAAEKRITIVVPDVVRITLNPGSKLTIESL